MQRIGRGSFGSVYLAEWNQTRIAVKLLVSIGACGQEKCQVPGAMCRSSRRVRAVWQGSWMGQAAGCRLLPPDCCCRGCRARAAAAARKGGPGLAGGGGGDEPHAAPQVSVWVTLVAVRIRALCVEACPMGPASHLMHWKDDDARPQHALRVRAPQCGAVHGARSAAARHNHGSVAPTCSAEHSLGWPACPPLLAACHACRPAEYCSRGSMYDCLAAAREHAAMAAQLTWRRRLAMAVDAGTGLLYLHRCSIIHRDGVLLVARCRLLHGAAGCMVRHAFPGLRDLHASLHSCRPPVLHHCLLQ